MITTKLNIGGVLRMLAKSASYFSSSFAYSTLNLQNLTHTQ